MLYTLLYRPDQGESPMTEHERQTLYALLIACLIMEVLT